MSSLRQLASILVLTATVLSLGAAAESDENVRPFKKWGVAYKGPEIEAAVQFYQAQRDLGEPRLIVVLQIIGSTQSDVSTIDRSAITAITPEGRRLPLITQNRYIEIYNEIRSRVRRAVDNAPTFQLHRSTVRPCDRWFLVPPEVGFADDEIYARSFEECSGPLVFEVPGGVQPGRWRVVIELEESRADISFNLESEE